MKTFFVILSFALATIPLRAEAQTNPPPAAFAESLQRIETQRAALKQRLAEIQAEARADTISFDNERKRGNHPDKPARDEKLRQQAVEKHVLVRKITALEVEEIRLRQQFKVPAAGKRKRRELATRRRPNGEVAPGTVVWSNFFSSYDGMKPTY